MPNVTVDESVAPHVKRITLNRPERLNAITFELVADLHDALDTVAADEACKVAVLTGAGRGFCAGLDLKDFGTPPAAGEHPHFPAGTTGQSFMANLTQHIRATPQIVVAAVNGPRSAAGCRWRWRATCGSRRARPRSARRSSRPGSPAPTSASPTCCRASSARRARSTSSSPGARSTPTPPSSSGIVSQVFDDDGFLDAALGVAEGIAAYTGIGLRMTKEVMWANLDTPNMAACIALENRNQTSPAATRGAGLYGGVHGAGEAESTWRVIHSTRS